MNALRVPEIDDGHPISSDDHVGRSQVEVEPAVPVEHRESVEQAGQHSDGPLDRNRPSRPRLARHLLHYEEGTVGSIDSTHQRRQVEGADDAFAPDGAPQGELSHQRVYIPAARTLDHHRRVAQRIDAVPNVRTLNVPLQGREPRRSRCPRVHASVVGAQTSFVSFRSCRES